MSSSDPTPGLLFVTMQPKDTLSLNLFHDWYNNEHGPNRTRLPFIRNGFRYRATDLPDGISTGTQSSPEYLAIYDITDMHQITLEPYQRLRAPPWKTQREIDTMAQIWVGRTLFDFAGEKVNDETFVELESPQNFEVNVKGNVLTTTRLLVDPEKVSEADDWLHQTTLPAVAKLPTWRRTRWFKTSYLEPREDKLIEILMINEFSPSTNAKTIPIFEKPPTKTSSSTVRTYDLFYTFGTAARHLSIVAPWTHPDGITRTIPAGTKVTHGSAIESTITTPDGAVLPFRLEGNNTDPDAPIIVLVNSILTTYHIWDSFLSSFFSNPSSHRFRILRFLSRGRSSNTGSTNPTTVDLLASDVIILLDSLRIPRAHCVVGVSLGGATALATALTYPSRIRSFVSCDTSAKSPAGNRETWGERIAVAEKEGKRLALASPFGDVASSNSETEPEPVVGEELAELTVRRWFHGSSYDDGKLASEIAKVKNMVLSNSLSGFKTSVEALFEYDYTSLMPEYTGKGAFVVGAGDGKLPAVMEKMAKELGKDSDRKAVLKVIDEAGHLPMVEKPEEVAGFMADFLADLS